MKLKHTVNKLILTAALALLALPSQALDEKDITVPDNYPEKYTAKYIKMIEPEYKVVGKDYIFYGICQIYSLLLYVKLSQ